VVIDVCLSTKGFRIVQVINVVTSGALDVELDLESVAEELVDIVDIL